MKRMLQLLSVSLLTIFLASCTTQTVDDEGATKLVEAFMKALNDGDYEAALDMGSEDFFGGNSRDQWIEQFETIKEHLGQRKKMKLKQRLSDVRLSGHFYIYQYATTYEKGLAKELITIVQKINTNEPLKITGYKIDSSKLR